MIQKTLVKLATGLLALGATGAAMAAGAVEITRKQPLNVPAIVMFAIFFGLTLGITYWAASRTKTASDFYTAGGAASPAFRMAWRWLATTCRQPPCSA